MNGVIKAYANTQRKGGRMQYPAVHVHKYKITHFLAESSTKSLV